MIRPLLAVALLAAGLLCGRPASAQEATPVPATTCGAPSGFLLAQAPAVADRQHAVSVLDPATLRELDRIDVPPVDAAYPTALPGKALAVAGDALYVIDSLAGSATRIALPDGDARELAPNPVQFRGTAGERFLLLGSPTFDRALLIDLERATATSLGALTGAPPESPVFISFAAVTPGDGHVVFWDGRAVYLAETADPTSAARISTTDFAFAPESSPDGREIVFSQSDGPGSGSTVMVHDIAGGRTRELIRRDRALVTLWIPGGRTLLVDARTESGAAAGRVTLLDVESGGERDLLAYSGSLTTVQFDPEGTRALIGVERIDGGEWHLANLVDATTTSLPQLAGSRIWPGLYADARWAFAVPPLDAGDPLAAPSYRAVDLETGTVARLLARDPALSYADPPELSPDGRFALVAAAGSAGARTWLLNAEAIDATELSGAEAHFSPDGCHVVVQAHDRGGSAVQVIPAGGERPRGSTSRMDIDMLAWVANASAQPNA